MNGFQRSMRDPEIRLVLGIGLMALLIRVVFSFVIFPYLAGPLALGKDPDHFGKLAQNWADGKGYVYYKGSEPTTWQEPAYPILLAAVYIVFGNQFPAAIIIQSLIGGLVCLVMYYIGKQVFGSWVGYTAALFGRCWLANDL
jgi:hypothetical protein